MGALTEEQAVNNLGVLLDRIELAGAYIWTVMDKYRDGTLAGARRGQVANLCDVTYINAMKDHVHRLFEESHDDATRIINDTHMEADMQEAYRKDVEAERDEAIEQRRKYGFTINDLRGEVRELKGREANFHRAAKELLSDAHEMMATAEHDDIGGMRAAYNRISEICDTLAATPPKPKPKPETRNDGKDAFERAVGIMKDQFGTGDGKMCVDCDEWEDSMNGIGERGCSGGDWTPGDWPCDHKSEFRLSGDSDESDE